MYSIDTSDAEASEPSRPVAGTEKYFASRDGSPDKGTVVPDWWLNMVQKEIRGVVTGAGLSPDKTNDAQLLAAINSLIAGGGGGGSVGFKSLSGLITENDSGDTAHDIQVASGYAMDELGATSINLASAMTKRIDAAWAVGTGNGGFPSAGGSGLTLTADTTYHLFLIAKPGGADPDIGWDTNLDASVLLNGDNAGGSGYTLYRRIWSNITNSSSDIIQYKQYGNRCQLATPIKDIEVIATGSNFDTLDTLTVPLGIRTVAGINMQGHWGSGSTSGQRVAVYEADYGSVAWFDTGSGDNIGKDCWASKEIIVNTSQQIKRKSDFATGSMDFRVYTNYWIDTRGKDD